MNEKIVRSTSIRGYAIDFVEILKGDYKKIVAKIPIFAQDLPKPTASFFGATPELAELALGMSRFNFEPHTIFVEDGRAKFLLSDLDELNMFLCWLCSVEEYREMLTNQSENEFIKDNHLFYVRLNSITVLGTNPQGNPHATVITSPVVSVNLDVIPAITDLVWSFLEFTDQDKPPHETYESCQSKNVLAEIWGDDNDN